MSHTPGPWFNVRNWPRDSGPIYIATEDDPEIGFASDVPKEYQSTAVLIAKLGAKGECTSQDDENANLIAAAPDLLAACKAFVAWAGECSYDHHDHCQEHGCVPRGTCCAAMARAAIAKAEGKP
jgi:hypothetical protein